MRYWPLSPEMEPESAGSCESSILQVLDFESPRSRESTISAAAGLLSACSQVLLVPSIVGPKFRVPGLAPQVSRPAGKKLFP
jgi:hypothetical protein